MSRKTMALSLVLGLCAVTSITFAQATETYEFEIIDLGFGGALGINNASISDIGMVVGWEDSGQAIMWNSEYVPTILAPGSATAINNLGQIAVNFDGIDETFRYNSQSDTWDYIPPVNGGIRNWVSGINDLGNVVGFYELDASYQGAFIWDGGTSMDLGNFGGSLSESLDINNNNQIAGYSYDASNNPHAFIWDGILQDLGSGEANGINDNGVVVGNSGDKAAKWAADINGIYSRSIIDDSDLSVRSSANATNNETRTVGWFDTAEETSHAFLWDPVTGMIDLNDYIPDGSGWELLEAYDINNSAQIVGVGVFGTETHAFLLNPTTLPELPLIPEPMTLSLLAIGSLAVLKRRK
ncbi:MAG: PEP-CTERM sorting domain-containing protein [Sedimentisphaerales bacterium]|nr:PEP-CTERM sorting domain-containing protein [Sedimentisphaerales bacterium]